MIRNIINKYMYKNNKAVEDRIVVGNENYVLVNIRRIFQGDLLSVLLFVITMFSDCKQQKMPVLDLLDMDDLKVYRK